MSAQYHAITKRSLFLFSIVVMLLAISLACSFAVGGPTPTLTLAPPTATSTPIQPTSTPTPIPGIDEPIILKNVPVKDVLGNTWTGDIQLQFLNAYTKDSLDNQSGTNSPGDPENIFLILEFELSGQSGTLDWTARNTTLTCVEYEYKVVMFGMEIGDDGKLKAWHIIFEVPQDSDIGVCILHIKEYAVELYTIFK